MNFLSALNTSVEGVDRDGAVIPRSVLKILDGALTALAARGARRLSMSDICDASGVSRGTLYRYFSTKDQVLEAVSEFVSLNFENGVRQVAAAEGNPMKRLRAVMVFYSKYTRERTPDRVFEVEPGFHLDFFRSHFERHKAAVESALDPTFDYIDTLLDTPMNRDGVAEALVRLQLSTLVVPVSDVWTQTWDSAPEILEHWIVILAGRTPAKKEQRSCL